MFWLATLILYSSRPGRRLADLSSSKLNKFNFNYRDAFSMSTCFFFFKDAKLERVTKFGTQERGNANLGTRKKSFEKARGNAKRKWKNAGTRHAKGLQERAPSSAALTNITPIFAFIRIFYTFFPLFSISFLWDRVCLSVTNLDMDSNTEQLGECRCVTTNELRDLLNLFTKC